MRGTFRNLLTLTGKFGVVATAGLVVFVAEPARADVSFPVTFGGAGNSFTANISASATFTISGSGRLELSSPPILGTPVGLLGANITLGQQTRTISANANINTTPFGTGTIRMSDNFQGSDNRFNPVPDGKADAGLPGSPVGAFMKGTLDALDVTLIQSQQIGTNSIQLDGDANFNLLGFIPVSVDLDLDATPTLVIQNVLFNQIGSALGMGNFGGQKSPNFGDGNHPFLPSNTLDLSSRYPFALPLGNLSGSAGGNLNAELSVNILGLNLGLGDFNLGIPTQSLVQQAPLIGDARFLQLPTANTNADDLQFRMSGALDDLLGDNLSLPFELSGVLPINESFQAPVEIDLGFLGSIRITFTGTFVGSANYSINGQVAVSNLTYALQSNTIANAVNVPEAGSMTMAGLAAVGGLGAFWVRRRRSA